MFDRLGPPPPIPIPMQQEDLRPRLVRSAIEIPPRRAQTSVKPRAKEKAPHPDAEGSTGSRKSPGGKRHQKDKREEITVKSETSDDEGSAARSGSKKPKRLEDQIARMAKELEELKKGKHQGTRKNPLGEMNAPFSRRIREADLPPKFKMPAEKYAGSEDPVSHLESFVQQMEIQNASGPQCARCSLQP